jgi:hypothetical protein
MLLLKTIIISRCFVVNLRLHKIHKIKGKRKWVRQRGNIECSIYICIQYTIIQITFTFGTERDDMKNVLCHMLSKITDIHLSASLVLFERRIKHAKYKNKTQITRVLEVKISTLLCTHVMMRDESTSLKKNTTRSLQ